MRIYIVYTYIQERGNRGFVDNGKSMHVIITSSLVYYQ